MNSLKPRTKLTPEQRLAVVKMLGSMMSITEVSRSMKENYGVDISRHSIDTYKRGMRGIQVEQERDKYLNNLKEVPIFHPKVRFVRFERMYNDGLAKNDSHKMAEALRLAQNEFKEKIGGDTYNIWSQSNQFNMDMSLEEIQARKEAIFNKLKRKELISGPSGEAGEDSGKQQGLSEV